MTDRRLLVATRSVHKLRELRELLALDHATIVSPDELGIEGDPVEDGETFETNAAIKARFGLRASGLPTLADDSGIEVDALGGGPGVRTRRYAGEDATDEANNQKLLAALRGLPPEERGARYVCALALALPDLAASRGGVRLITARGTCRGRIATEPRGVAGSATTRSSSRPRSRPVAGRWASGRRPRSTRSRIAPGPPGGWPRDSRRSGSETVHVHRICVFCGASPGRSPRYLELAASVGAGLARRGIGVVYGGGRVGMMGALADAALAAGGEVIGVIPRRLVDRELAHPALTQLRVVETLHERKAGMAALADGFIALPGGLGTLEELAEVASWAQLGLHAKPIGLLGGPYWDALLPGSTRPSRKASSRRSIARS